MTESSGPRFNIDPKLLNVAQDVAMAEHHPFGFARGSAGEEEDRLFSVSLERQAKDVA